ncbi:hypothetical protein A2U01_0050734 [Trifolium medium]|uniref:Uncharacterized protein n=1 Tax=Trifolium medium TaxID=97028 RepID=A0A392R1V5_9FABA|nr:hypothetical protein [Trifolium medium]
MDKEEGDEEEGDAIVCDCSRHVSETSSLMFLCDEIIVDFAISSINETTIVSDVMPDVDTSLAQSCQNVEDGFGGNVCFMGADYEV